MCGSNSLFLRDKLGFEGSLSSVCHCAQVGLWQGCVSVFPTHFDIGNFSVIQCDPIVVESLNYFWISLRGNFSMGSSTFGVSVGGEKIRSLLRCHLGDVTHVNILLYFILIF